MLISPSVGGDLFVRRSRGREIGPLLVAQGLGRAHRPIAVPLFVPMCSHSEVAMIRAAWQMRARPILVRRYA
ncbi:hypothetical protein HY78_30320 (plasmid) [Rhizorhabdus wittichii DC-6]|nr:hypothetical protein HY78_30320 [Rhizorhabdus wittichii DC-6]